MPEYNIPAGETYPLAVDCAQYLGGAAIRVSKYCGAIRYVTNGGSQLPQKQLTAWEARTYLVNDILLVSNFESDGRPGNGYNTGYSDAETSVANHIKAGGPPHATIYFSIDYDAPESDQPLINDYLKGIYDYMAGEYLVGLYSGYWVCSRARTAFPNLKIWQTMAWSGNNILPDIEILQRIGADEINGAAVDVNEIRKPGHIGGWQEAMDGNTQFNSIVDGKPYTVDQYIAFIDYHTYHTSENTTQLLDRLATMSDQLAAVKAEIDTMKGTSA